MARVILKMPMRFHFSSINHNDYGRMTLHDMRNWFQAGLEGLGHEVSFSRDRLDPTRINVLWEHFWPEMAEALVRSNIRYGIIATEIPTENSFNNRTELAWTRRWKG